MRKYRYYKQRDGNFQKEKEMPEIKNTVTKMKNASDGLINMLNTGRERVSELKEMSIETPMM